MIYGVPDPQKVCGHSEHFQGNHFHQVPSLSEKQSCQPSLPIRQENIEMVIRRKSQLLPSAMFLPIEVVVSFTKSTMMTIQHSVIADWLSFSNWDITDPKKETTVWQENEDQSCPPRWDLPSAEKKCWLLCRSWGTFLTLNGEEMHFSAPDLTAGKMIDGYNTFFSGGASMNCTQGLDMDKRLGTWIQFVHYNLILAGGGH